MKSARHLCLPALLITACTGTDPAAVPDPAPPEAPEAAIELNRPPAEVDILAAGAPEPNAMDHLTLEIAKAHGVGIGRCALRGAGRVIRKHGTIRDHVFKIGPKMMVELDDEIPWNPIYDEVVSADDWVTVLVQPGATQAFVEVGDRMVGFTFPPAVAGDTVVCTNVQTVAPRVVRGKVPGRESPMVALGCTEEGVRVAKDGTFVVEADTPCSLWVETRDGFRTDPVRIEPGDGKLDLGDLEVRPDGLQNVDRTWTDAGRASLQQIVDDSAVQTPKQLALLSTLMEKFKDDRSAAAMARRWHGHFKTWERGVVAIRDGLAGKVPL